MSNVQQEYDLEEEEDEERAYGKKTGKRYRDRRGGEEDEDDYAYRKDEEEGDWDVGNGKQDAAEEPVGMLFDGYLTNRKLLTEREGDVGPLATDRE